MAELLDDELVKTEKKYIRIWPLILWGSILFIGLIFKVLDIPGREAAIFLSTACIFSYSISRLISLPFKPPIYMATTIMGSIWIGILIWGAFFNGGYPYNTNGLIVYSGAMLLSFGIYRLADYVRKKQKIS